tara:strand:+ start:132 stop:353 length:222 start_codon:yes stop_codon:yes gene_type:complete
MDEWNDKELYYFFTVEATLEDDPSLETLQEHLRNYEKKEEYLACAGIKLGIEFARFNRLFNLYRDLENDKRHY